MERAIEKGTAFDNLAVDGDRQGIMPSGSLKECADRVGRLGRLEGDCGSVGPGGAVVRDDMGRIAAEEVGGLQHQAAAGAWVPAGDAPAQGAAPARESEKPEPGGVLRLGDAGLPAALADGAVDGKPRGLAHLFQGVSTAEVGPCRPDAAFQPAWLSLKTPNTRPQQDRRIGDPGAIVDESNAGSISVLLDGRGNARGAATA